jgi:hypothetical protein
MSDSLGVYYMTPEDKKRLDSYSLTLMAHLVLQNDDQVIHGDDRHTWMAEEAVKYALALIKAQGNYVAIPLLPTEPASSTEPQSPPQSRIDDSSMAGIGPTFEETRKQALASLAAGHVERAEKQRRDSSR